MTMLAFKTKRKAEAFAKRIRGRNKMVSGNATYSCPPGAVQTARVGQAPKARRDPEWPYYVVLGCRRR